jgi:hypothetical protein
LVGAAGIDTCLKSKAGSIIQDWLVSWEVEAAIDNPEVASFDILFNGRAGVDRCPASKGTPLSSRTEEASHKLGRSGGRSGAGGER